MSRQAERQLALDLGHRPALARTDFIAAPCNAHALAWIDRWPDWPGPALVIHGPPACGKSHLAAVWAARSGARWLDGRDLAGFPNASLSALNAVVLDAADSLESAQELTGLFHLYNHLSQSGGHLLLTGRSAPARWSLPLADLRSRLIASPAVGVLAPDEALLSKLMTKLFADRQIQVGDDVIRWMLARIERTPDAARRLVEALDGAALAQGRAITIPLARSILDARTDS